MMQLSLPPELLEFVEAKVVSGAYSSQADVVRDALSRWRSEELIDPAELKRLVDIGQAAADRGELRTAEEVFTEIRERSTQRRANGG